MAESVASEVEMKVAELLLTLSDEPNRKITKHWPRVPTTQDKDEYIAWLEARLQEVIKEAQDLDAQLYYTLKRCG